MRHDLQCYSTELHLSICCPGSCSPPDMKGSSGHSIFPPPPVLRRSSDVLDKSTVHVLDERKAPRHTLGGWSQFGPHRTSQGRGIRSLCLFSIILFVTCKRCNNFNFSPFFVLMKSYLTRVRKGRDGHALQHFSIDYIYIYTHTYIYFLLCL